MGASLAQGETRKRTFDPAHASIPELVNVIKECYDANQLAMLVAMKSMLKSTSERFGNFIDLDTKTTLNVRQCLPGKIELLDLAITMRKHENDAKEAKNRLNEAQASNNSKKIMEAQKSWDQSMQRLSEAQEAFKRRAEELAAQTKQ